MRISSQLALAAMLAVTVAGYAQQNKATPLASAESRQPDRELFDRAVQFFEYKKYEQAVLVLRTLINSYPDSRYAERAKLKLEDCWRLPECAVSRTQVEALPNGGGFSALPVPATGTLEFLCDNLGTAEIKLDITPGSLPNQEPAANSRSLPLILHVYRKTIEQREIKEPLDAISTVCDPDRTCDRDLKARVQFTHFSFKAASGSYVIERSDGRKQAGSFKVRGKPINRCE